MFEEQKNEIDEFYQQMRDYQIRIDSSSLPLAQRAEFFALGWEENWTNAYLDYKKSDDPSEEIIDRCTKLINLARSYDVIKEGRRANRAEELSSDNMKRA